MLTCTSTVFLFFNSNSFLAQARAAIPEGDKPRERAHARSNIPHIPHSQRTENPAPPLARSPAARAVSLAIYDPHARLFSSDAAALTHRTGHIIRAPLQ